MAVNSCNLLDEASAWSSSEGTTIGGLNTTKAVAGLVLPAQEAKFLIQPPNNVASQPTAAAATTPDNNRNLNSNNNNSDITTSESKALKQMPGCAVEACQHDGPVGTLASDSALHNGVAGGPNLSVTSEDAADFRRERSSSSSELDQKRAGSLLSTENQFSPVSSSSGAAHSRHNSEVFETEKRPTTEESIDGNNQTATSHEEEENPHPDWIEERFKVDRRKLEQMLQAASDGRGQTGEAFFDSIMKQTSTEITWPSKLKIGAKSKKDPHIKVRGMPTDVARAKELTMMVLDTKCTRVTLKMDVSHTEHSHVIGKGGNNIKRVMEDTGCHIHFPDSNRNGTAEKSNQVSIAGQPSGVESARAKIRELLPIVVTFDLAMSGAIPDPNSSPIQHLVQLYNVSVQFKQRAKVYCTTTCTVRGSNDNVSGLVEGTIKLMQHLTGGAMVQVVSQMEVAPQQHSYMLGRNASNVKHIMHRTGAQIRFPDPNCVPKKSTIYVTGPIEAVVMARQRLMGCLPLVLMFDMKQEELQSPTEEATRNNQLMESLDVFISIKLKPKQPSKSVIVKSVERNIYNMFEARRQLLKLNSTGLKTPPPPASPPALTLTSSNSVGPGPPIILTPSPRLISYIPPNGVTVVPRPATPTGPLMRTGWSNSPMPSPSPSPFPLSQQATVAAIHAQQQQHLLLAQINAQAVASANASRASSIAGSPPSQNKQEDDMDPSPLQVAKQFIQKNNMVRQQQHKQQQQQQFQDRDNNGNYYPTSGGGEGSPTTPTQFDDNVRGIQRHLMEVRRNGGNLSANSSFNKGNSDKVLPHRHSMGQLLTNHREEAAAASQAQRHSLPDGMDIVNKVFLQVSSASRNRIPMNTPPGSDRNSPMSVLSERIGDVRVPSPDGSTKVISMHKSPSSSASSIELQTALRHLQNSPSGRAYLHPDRAKEQRMVAFAEERKNHYHGAAESPSESELRELTEYFGDSTRAPPPGFENFPKSAHSPLNDSDYENWRQKAYQAMRHQPVATEVRTPTDTWSGLYFSHSMPVQELKKAKEAKYQQQLATTYEREDAGSFEEGEGPDAVTAAAANQLALSQNLANSSRGGSALVSWRERQNLSHSLHSQVTDLGDSLPPKRRQHSTFDPYEYINRSIPTPPHPNDDPSPPPQYREGDAGKSPGPGLQNQPLEAALSLLTDNHLGGPNCVDLHDLLKHLNLGKYSEVFAKQEVDLQTFLTLTESDLTELGITVFGPRRKILLAIEELKKNRGLLYSGVNALNAAPGAPGLTRAPLAPPQQRSANMLLHQKLGGLLESGSSVGEAPVMPGGRSRIRENPSHSSLSSSRLLSGGKGIVSQSGRW